MAIATVIEEVSGEILRHGKMRFIALPRSGDHIRIPADPTAYFLVVTRVEHMPAKERPGRMEAPDPTAFVYGAIDPIVDNGQRAAAAGPALME